jgi:hypothetical protein
VQTLNDLAIGLSLLGGGAFVIAGAAAYAAGRSFRRAAAIALAGIPIAAGLFLVVWSGASPTEACHDCDQILGRWMSGVIVFYLLVNVTTWVAGAILGWAIRSRPRNVY